MLLSSLYELLMGPILNFFTMTVVNQLQSNYIDKDRKRHKRYGDIRIFININFGAGSTRSGTT